MKYLAAFALFLAACNPANGETAFEAEAALTGDVLIVGNKQEDTVSFIDLESGEERTRVATGNQPHEIAISPDRRRAAVVAYGGTTIDIFDIANATRIDRIDISPNQRPHGLVWTPDNRLIATTEGSSTLTIVDMDDGSVSAIPTGQRGSHMVAVNAAGTRAYVANMGSGTVSAVSLDERRKLADVEAGDTPEGLALTPDGSELWVADRDNAVLHVFDTESFDRIASITTGNFPIRVAISPDGTTAVTSNAADGSLTLVDTATKEVTRTIPVSGPDAVQVTIVFSEDGRTIYAAETAQSRVVAVDLESGEIIDTYAAGAGSDGLGVVRRVSE
ncbi:MAG: beta-propeller fold lactonase family protein [Sphingomonadaceae bacterium]|nr:beta-propeller fold lactonase family protein [Sphingomonadaceae bacterium]